MSSRKRSSIKRKHSPTNDTFSTDESNPSSSSSSKRKKQSDTEKRLRRYRATMTVGIYDRIERALNQRLYLLAITKSSNESFSREYKVLGQTANVYTVVISHLPSCTCKFQVNLLFVIKQFFQKKVRIMLKVIYVNILSLFYIVYLKYLVIHH
jgi:hypothetical protein